MAARGVPQADDVADGAAYRIFLSHDDREDVEERWLAEVPELPGCVAHGRTPEQAATRIQAAVDDWIAGARERGETLPRPRSSTHSGRLLVRMPQTLHGELARAAETEGISLNQLITGILSSGIGWRGAAGDERVNRATPRGDTSTGTRDLTRLALAANLIVVLVAGAAAIALLAVALTHGW